MEWVVERAGSVEDEEKIEMVVVEKKEKKELVLRKRGRGGNEPLVVMRLKSTARLT